MKHAYVTVPAALMVAFLGYYAWWERQARNPQPPAVPSSIRTTGDDEYRRRDGHKEALADIAAGKPKLKGYGLMLGDDSMWREVLKERFGIEVETIAGCVVTESLVSYAEAYNVTIEHFVAANHGVDALAEAREEAEDRLEARYPRKG